MKFLLKLIATIAAVVLSYFAGMYTYSFLVVMFETGLSSAHLADAKFWEHVTFHTKDWAAVIAGIIFVALIASIVIKKFRLATWMSSQRFNGV